MSTWFDATRHVVRIYGYRGGPLPEKRSPESNKAMTKRLTKKGLQRRAQILDAASQRLVEVGMEGLSLNSIAAKVGISLGNLQYYFPYKKNCYSSCFNAR